MGLGQSGKMRRGEYRYSSTNWVNGIFQYCYQLYLTYYYLRYYHELISNVRTPKAPANKYPQLTVEETLTLDAPPTSPSVVPVVTVSDLTLSVDTDNSSYSPQVSTGSAQLDAILEVTSSIILLTLSIIDEVVSPEGIGPGQIGEVTGSNRLSEEKKGFPPKISISESRDATMFPSPLTQFPDDRIVLPVPQLQLPSTTSPNPALTTRVRMNGKRRSLECLMPNVSNNSDNLSLNEQKEVFGNRWNSRGYFEYLNIYYEELTNIVVNIQYLFYLSIIDPIFKQYLPLSLQSLIYPLSLLSHGLCTLPTNTSLLLYFFPIYFL